MDQISFFHVFNDELFYVTLNKGEQRTFHHSFDNGEGTSWEAETLVWDDDDFVECQWAMGGNDCDGSHRQTGEQFCLISDLTNGELRFEIYTYDCGTSVKMPKWQKGSASECFDSFAEALNY